MIRKLAPYTRGYRIWIVLGVLCSAGEAVLELLLPKLMSNIVDVGIAGGDRAYILATGTKMVLMALCSLALGIGAAALSSRAGMGFGANLRLAEYTQVQKFSFSNIEHFSTASLITRLTNDVSSVQMMLMMGMRMLVRAPGHAHYRGDYGAAHQPAAEPGVSGDRAAADRRRGAGHQVRRPDLQLPAARDG